MVTQETLCKTVSQYSKEPIPARHMEKLREIAEDYRSVKNYVYARYGGIGSLSKLYPGYTVQNEMTDSGLRGELGMPAVHFYLAIFDALGDIKSQWTQTKTKVSQLVGRNENLTAEEKHYLRFLLKSNNAFEAVLNRRPVTLSGEIRNSYERLASQVDKEKLHRYLCRQVRKYHVRQQTAEAATGFFVTERAYRYGDHGIYLSTKQNRKRIFVPLTDNNQYKSQIYVRLYPEESRIEIRVPVNVTVRSRPEYQNEVGLAMGMFAMLTTHEGHVYGEKLGDYQTAYARWIREQTISYRRNRSDNPGRKKYYAKKDRLTAGMHGYINQELNRFFRTEKPGIVYIAKLPNSQAGGVNRKINHSVTLWQRGYIRERLAQKCREQSVEFVEVFGKDISNMCSCCGTAGEKRDGVFFCSSCAYTADEKTNTAQNAFKRGQERKSP